MNRITWELSLLGNWVTCRECDVLTRALLLFSSSLFLEFESHRIAFQPCNFSLRELPLFGDFEIVIRSELEFDYFERRSVCLAIVKESGTKIAPQNDLDRHIFFEGLRKSARLAL